MQNELEIENQIKSVLSEVFKDLIINTKQTFDLFLKQKNASDLIALYDFYYYTAKWQKTNQPKATIHYVMKRLKWGEQKVRKRKKQLVELGLISDIRKKNKNKYLGWYIKINYIWGENTILDKVKTTLLENNRVVGENETTLLENYPVKKEQGGNQAHKCLKCNNLNALNTNIKKISKDISAKAKKASQDYKIISDFLEEIKKILKIDEFAEQPRWSRSYAHLCLRDYGREKTLKGTRWLEEEWPQTPMRMKTIYYGMREFLEKDKPFTVGHY